MRWFRGRRGSARVRPVRPGELIDGTTPEGRARAYEVFGSLPKVRESPPLLCPNDEGISVGDIVIRDRGPY